VPDVEERSRSDFDELTTLLAQRADHHRKSAYTIGLLGVAGLAVAAFLGWKATQSGAAYLKESDYSTVALTFELVRSAAAAALLAAGVWGVLNLARASLDQATRYEKRLIAGKFLNYVLDRFETEVKNDGKIPLPQVMNVFKEWSDTVDTAFTNVKFGSKKNQSISMSAGSKGIAAGTGGAQSTPPS